MHTQEALDLVTREAFEEFYRQEVKGTIKTTVMALRLVRKNGSYVDEESPSTVQILDLTAGQSIYVGADRHAMDIINSGMNTEDQIQRLKDECGYATRSRASSRRI